MTADFASLQTFPRLFYYFLTRCVSIIFQLTKESIRLKNRAATKKKRIKSFYLVVGKCLSLWKSRRCVDSRTGLLDNDWWRRLDDSSLCVCVCVLVECGGFAGKQFPVCLLGSPVATIGRKRVAIWSSYPICIKGKKSRHGNGRTAISIGFEYVPSTHTYTHARPNSSSYCWSLLRRWWQSKKREKKDKHLWIRCFTTRKKRKNRRKSPTRSASTPFWLSFHSELLLFYITALFLWRAFTW